MSILATPLEPLAFDFVSFGFYPFVSNLWPWLALVTAAVSFWKIRAVGSTSSSSSSSSSSFFDSDESSNVSTPPISEETPASSSAAPNPAAASAAVTTIRRSEDDGVVTKGLKFTVYYDNDDEAEEEEEGDGELTVTEKGAEVECGGDWWKSWEEILKVKRGETSWYRYQDLTEINGNVVRLWDGCRIRPETCISQNCVVW